MKRIRATLLVTTVAGILSYSPASPQVVVFDPNNYAQNILQAARALQQINNQITSLQNQAQMLVNQTRNLASLPQSSLNQIQQSIQRTQQLLGEAQRIAYDVGQIDYAFSTTYGAASTATDQALIVSARERWHNSVAGIQDAMKVHAGVVANLDTNRVETSSLVTASQAATGALQATQAGNQLIALQTQQISDLTAAVAAQGRAQNLEAAQRTAAQEQAREQLRRFLTPGAGYRPANVRMFQ
ncbi:MAG: P-type conjugative transfer protein TrbJ [Pseudomonadota bacterium]